MSESRQQPIAESAMTTSNQSKFSWKAFMNPILGLVKKELYSYFYSPIAYVVIVIYLAFTGWFFFSRFFLFGQLELRAYFGIAPLLLMFLAPAITMRLISEETYSGSYELLMTLPISAAQMLLGKFIAALTFLAITIGITLSYPLTVGTIGPLDWGPIIAGYIGLMLLGGSYLAVGLLTSALTRNQIVAFILGFAICFLLFLFDKTLDFVPGPLIGLFQYLGITYHFQNFTRGVIDSKDVVYFLTLLIITLSGTRLILARRK